jgi:hypothetical protein
LGSNFDFWIPPLLPVCCVCLFPAAANNQNPPHLGACQHPNNDDFYPNSDNCSTATTINNAQAWKAVTMGRGKQWITVEKKKTASLDFRFSVSPLSVVLSSKI